MVSGVRHPQRQSRRVQRRRRWPGQDGVLHVRGERQQHGGHGLGPGGRVRGVHDGQAGGARAAVPAGGRQELRQGRRGGGELEAWRGQLRAGALL